MIYNRIIINGYEKEDNTTLSFFFFVIFATIFRFIYQKKRMKEFIISEAKVETAVLVGLITQTQDERKTNEYLDELAFLAETAGAEVVKRFTQKLPTANSVTYVEKGNWKRSDNIYERKRKKNVK